jgi:hypothetical protein
MITCGSVECIKAYRKEKRTSGRCIDCRIPISYSAKRCRLCASMGKNNSFYGKTHTEETKKKLKQLFSKGQVSFMKGKNHSNEAKNKNRLKHIGIKPSEETKQKRSKSITEIWQNADYKERTIKSILKGLFETRPTSLERQMMKIIEHNNLPFEYVGDGSFLIGYKNPDFINTNGKKICIEVGNIFHHKGDYSQKRKEHFAKYGWNCIIFIANKLDETKIMNDLRGVLC